LDDLGALAEEVLEVIICGDPGERRLCLGEHRAPRRPVLGLLCRRADLVLLLGVDLLLCRDQLVLDRRDLISNVLAHRLEVAELAAEQHRDVRGQPLLGGRGGFLERERRVDRGSTRARARRSRPSAA